MEQACGGKRRTRSPFDCLSKVSYPVEQRNLEALIQPSYISEKQASAQKESRKLV